MPDRILLEDGDVLLLEDGSNALLESSSSTAAPPAPSVAFSAENTYGAPVRVAFHLWSGSKYSTGTANLGVITDVTAAWDRRTIKGEDHVDLDVSRLSTVWNSTYLDNPGYVVNVVRYDWLRVPIEEREYRISRITEGETEQGHIVSQIHGEWVGRFDLARGAQLERIEKNGFVQPHFELYGVTPTQHLSDVIISPPSSSSFKTGASAFYSVGTVESTVAVDMIYDWENPLSATISLGEVSVLEPWVTESSTGYLVNLLTRVGSTLDKPYVKLGRNVLSVRRDNENEQQATRIYMKGGGDVGDEASIADNALEIASTGASGAMTMVDNCVLEANQYSAMGVYAEMPDGTLRQVTAASTPNVITVPGATISGGDFMRLRRNSSGAFLTYLEKPTAVAKWGVISRTITRSDIPRIDNEAPNPFFKDWSGGTPTSWTVIGSPTIAQNTAELYSEFGKSSVHISNASEGAGIYSADITVTPSSKRPHYTTQIAIWVASGRFRVELWDVTNAASPVVYPRDVSNIKAVTSETGTWTYLGLAHGEDHNLYATTTFQIRILADSTGGTAEAYIDAAQLTNTAGGEPVFWDGRASNQLLLAANDELELYAEPLERYELDAIDIQRMIEAGVESSTSYGAEAFQLGGDVRFRVPSLGFESTQRIIGIERNLLSDHEGRLELETELERLTREQEERRRRQARDDTPEQVRRPSCPQNVVAIWSDIVVVTWNRGQGSGRTELRWAAVSTSTDWQATWNDSATLQMPGTPIDSEEWVIDQQTLLDLLSTNGITTPFLGGTLIAEAVSKHGLYSRCWQPASITGVIGPIPCPNYAPANSFAEIFSTCSTANPNTYSTYSLVDLSAWGLSSGEVMSYGYEGKLINCSATGSAGAITDGFGYWRTSQSISARVGTNYWNNSTYHAIGVVVGGGFAQWQAMKGWIRATSTATGTDTWSVATDSDGISGNHASTRNYQEQGYAGLMAWETLSTNGPLFSPRYREFRLMKERNITITASSGAAALISDFHLRRDAGEFSQQTDSETFSTGLVQTFAVNWRAPFHRFILDSTSGSTLHVEVPSSNVWPGDSWQISTSTASTSGLAMSRVTAGLIYKTSFPGGSLPAGWVTSAGSNWTVSGGEVSYNSTVFGFAVYTGTNLREEMYVQCETYQENRFSPRPGILARIVGVGQSTFDCQSAVDLDWLDSNSSAIGSNNVASAGVTGLSYQSICHQSTIPAGAAYARFQAKKKGTGDCRPFARRVVFNRGHQCCLATNPLLFGPGIPPRSSGVQGVAISPGAVPSCTSTAGIPVTVTWSYSTGLITANTLVDIAIAEEFDPTGNPNQFIGRHLAQGIAVDAGSTVPQTGAFTYNFGVGNIDSTGITGRGSGSTADLVRKWRAHVTFKQFNFTVGQGTSPDVATSTAYGFCT